MHSMMQSSENTHIKQEGGQGETGLYTKSNTFS